MSKSKTRTKAKGPAPILIKYEMIKAQEFLPYLGNARYTYSKNQAALRQIYSGTGANMLFCSSSIAREWIASFTTNAVDIGTGLINKEPHFISMQIMGAHMASTAVLVAGETWKTQVAPELDRLSMRVVSVDVVLRAKA